VEHTELYAMDAPLTASVELDMTCVAASMYQISSSNSEPHFTRSALRQRMQTQLGEDTDTGEGEGEREEEDEDEAGRAFGLGERSWRSSFSPACSKMPPLKLSTKKSFTFFPS
jgi:hypothetical protein